MSREVVIGVVQMYCENGNTKGNLEKAEKFARVAASKNVKLIVFPELMSSGYELTELAWDTAEPPENGPTETFLKNIAVECQCYIGASYLQAYPDGHFHNVFSLADPKGTISRIYKSEPASFEAFFFSGPPKFDLNGKPFRNPRVIETEFGRVGIQICYENLLYDVAVQMRESKPDLIVSPFSCPIAVPHKRSFPARDALYFNDVIDNIGGRISHLHKVPTVYCNKTGLCQTPLPMATITGYPKVESTYPGKCSVWDNQGTVLDQLNREFEGVLIGNVTLKTTVKGLPNIPCWSGGFIIRPVFTIRMFRVIEWIGRMSYGKNQIRYDKAREICAGFKNSPLYRNAAAPLTWSRLARDYLVLAGVISWCYVQSKQ